MTFAAPPRTIHYPLAAKVVGHFKRQGVPGDYRTVEQRLQLDDTEPDDSRYYAAMVACGWGVLAFGFIVAIGLAFPVGAVLGEQAGNIVAAACVAAAFFCLAGCVNALWHMTWHVLQAGRSLREHGAGSEGFKRSMRRSLPANTSLVFQIPVAILAFVLAL
jgi:ribose/xylose/arabinose/galactoside ABC-type transport system permease subunit